MIRRVVGHSMYPTLRPGQVVIASRWAEPKVGSIVIARIGESEIIKRIMDISSVGIKLAGDNIDDSRQFGLISSEAILGKVIWPYNVHKIRG